MAQANKLNEYLDDIHSAMHADNFSAQDFLQLVINVLTDFSQRMDAGEFRFEPSESQSEPIETTIGTAVTIDEHATLIPLADAASERATEVDPASLHTPTPAEAIEAAQPSLTAVAAHTAAATQTAEPAKLSTTLADVPADTASDANTNDHWQDWDISTPAESLAPPTESISAPIEPTSTPAESTSTSNELTSTVNQSADQIHFAATDTEPLAVDEPQVMTEASESSDVSHAADILSNNARIATENLESGDNSANTPQLDAANKFTETFDNGLGAFNHKWGDVEAHDGYIELTSPASTHDNASAMIAPNGADSGFGYGMYSFTLSTSSDVVGPYALLWPATDHWPGPEIDVFEIGGANGESLNKPYSTLHWNNNGNDGFEWHVMPGGIDPTEVHTYSVNWEDDALTYFVDGEAYSTITDHVPKDFAHGGENAAPSVGQLTHWWTDQNTVDNSMKVYEFSYTPNQDTVLA